MLPSDLLDLTLWKLDIPVDEQGGTTGTSEQVFQPELAAFAAPYFAVEAGAVRMSAPVYGATSSGSDYPRCELREMREDGEEADWSIDDGHHELSLQLSVDHLPAAKPRVVVAQIHSTSGGYLEVMADGKAGETDSDVGLVMFWLGERQGTFDPHYRLGRRFRLRLVADEGELAVLYDDVVVFSREELTDEGCYFKVGAYVNSNPSFEGDAQEYGAVTLERLELGG